MERNTGLYMSERGFPGFSVAFFTYENYLVPVNRSLITSENSWSLLLSPGRIWSEPGDAGMSRASFPFSMGSPAQRQITGGEVHNGVATFLFDESGASQVRIQITQETSPDGNIYDMWGQFPLDYEPGPGDNRDSHAAAFAAELEDQMPIRPWSELEAQYDPEILTKLTKGLEPEEVSAAGIVLDGIIYLQSSRTRYGEYPYPRYMHHAAMSISKSVGAGVGMLWLAEKYGREVFDLRVADYIEVTAEHDGWKDVTFGDLLNMAAGVGENAPELRPFDPVANEKGPNYVNWYLAETTAEKLRIIFLAGNYPWEPGELFRYTSSQTFLLSAAMDAYLKSMEGPDAHLWEQMMSEVFNPIGIHHLSMMHVPNGIGNPGVPLFSSGLRYTVDDVGKIVTLLQNGGQHDGIQMLHPGKLEEALLRTGEPSGLPTGKTFANGNQGYHMSFWSIAHLTGDGRCFQVPFMSGAGGNTIMLLPNGVSTLVFTDANNDGYSLNIPSLGEALRSYPDRGVCTGWMIAGKGVWLIPEVRKKVRTANILLFSWLVAALASAAFVGWHSGRRQIHSRGRRLGWTAFTAVTGLFGLAAYALSLRKGK
jgi:CubicO group peptidase (beta-lactamase class C family)